MTADTTPFHATHQAAELFSLPLGRASHPGPGNGPGQSTGSSIDFHDHRSCLPGDDPRHIDWAASARHFASWSPESREWAVPLGWVPSSGPLVSALTAHALPVGAVVFAR